MSDNAKNPATPLPCPFCSGTRTSVRKLLRDGYEKSPSDPDAHAYTIVCGSCAAEGGWAKSESGASRLWNTRIPPVGAPPEKAIWRKIAHEEQHARVGAEIEVEALRARADSAEADTARLDALDGRRVVSIAFADGSELNPGSLALRPAIDLLRAARSSSPDHSGGSPV